MYFLSFLSKTRYFFITIFALVLLFLLWQWVSPLGRWSCYVNFSNNNLHHLFNTSSSACLSQPSPLERYAYGPEGKLIMLADPLYFSVFSPRRFEDLELEIIFKPHLSEAHPIFELGFLADEKLWRYQLKPVYNLWLENVSDDWHSVANDSLYLFQREDNFSSISDFFNSWPENREELCGGINCLAVYNISEDLVPLAFQIDHFPQGEHKSIFPYAFRGAHQFYFYLTDDTLELSGSFQDLNKNKDRDDLEILIFKERKQVAAIKIIDNRVEEELSGEISAWQNFRLSRDDLSTGLYNLEIRASDDLIIDKLSVNSPYLSAVNKIWPISEEPISLITDSSHLQIKALSPLALQNINFADQIFNISEIYKQYELLEPEASWNQIKLSRGGLILETNGVFASHPNTLLNPRHPRLDRFTFNSKNIDFILADYNKVERLDNDWYRAKINFSTNNFYRENNQYNLILSVPGMRLDSGAGGLLEIKSIKVNFKGNNLKDKLKNIFKL